MAELKVTILGCGSSGGVPRLGDHWGACDPSDPKNRRRRCSLLLERFDGDGITRVLIDASPDLRAQLLDAGIGELDGVVFTHEHADHTHGLDDLRMIVFNTKKRLEVWADKPTANSLTNRFAYAFVQAEGSSYPPILNLNAINGPFEVSGAGGNIQFHPFEVAHGSINAQGFRIHDIAYLPDVSEMPDENWQMLQGLECWILDALGYKPHPTHINLETALAWIKRVKPTNAVLTNMHIGLDYKIVNAETPENVLPAHDGLTLTFEI